MLFSFDGRDEFSFGSLLEGITQNLLLTFTVSIFNFFEVYVHMRVFMLRNMREGNHHIRVPLLTSNDNSFWMATMLNVMEKWVGMNF